MASRKKCTPAEPKARKAPRTKPTSLFEVTFGGQTKIVEAASKVEIRKALLAGFAVKKLGPNEAFQAGVSGAQVEPLADASELGIG